MTGSWEQSLITFKTLTFEEAVRFFKEKIPLTPTQYRQLTDTARARAFAVSGVARMDVVRDLYVEMDRAIAEGKAIGDFKRSVKEIMTRRGWAGTNPYRLDTIYRTNTQMAYQAGHYSQMMAVAKARPYWRYVAVMDSRTRPAHAVMNGRVISHDDPFWGGNFPPNGFNCRCQAVSMSADEVTRGRLKAEKDVPNIADTGFLFNPGATMGKTLTGEQFEKLQGDPGRWTPLIQKTFENYSRLPARQVTDYNPSTTGLWPRGDKAVDLYKARLTGKAIEDPLHDSFILNDPFIDHLTLDGRERFLPLIEEAVSNPYEIWLQAEKEKATGRIVLRRRYVSFIRAEKNRRLLVIAENTRGFWTGYTIVYTRDARYIDNVREGVLLYGK